jgi:hypothetical protein
VQFKSKLVAFLILAFCGLGSPSVGALDFIVEGFLQQRLIFDQQHFNPYSEDTGWDYWRGGYFEGGRPLDRNYPMTGWGGARLGVDLKAGSLDESLYTYFSVSFNRRIFNQNQGQTSLTNPGGDYIVAFRDDNFTASITRRGMWDRNKTYGYYSPDDPFGALKLTNSQNPVLTGKITGKLPHGLEYAGYYMQDLRCNYVPRRETIPDQVYKALGVTKETMPYFDEMPVYGIFRATQPLNAGWTLGLLWGHKEAININPRAVEEDGDLPYPRHGIGFQKKNYGLDLVGQLPWLNNPRLTVAAIDSHGQWRQYVDARTELGLVPTWESLGEENGKALKFVVEDLQLGKANVTGKYHFVDPDFQWIAVRDRRYAYTHTFFVWGPDTTSVRATLDEDFHLRRREKQEVYVSDLDIYHGLQTGEISLGLPLPLKQTQFGLDLSWVKNLGAEGVYLDPDTWYELRDDYRQFKANFALPYTGETTLKLAASGRDYLHGPDYRQEGQLGWTMDLYPELKFDGNFGIVKRYQDAKGLGIGRKGDLTFKGTLSDDISFESSVDYRAGNYDYDLLRATRDSVLADAYSYLSFENYLELRRTIQLGGLYVDAVAAGELVNLKTNFASLSSGTALIGYLEEKTSVGDGLELTLTQIGVAGPKEEGFASNCISSLANYRLSYYWYGNADNTVNLEVTQRYREGKTLTNYYLTFLTEIGQHYLKFEYGRKPRETRNYFDFDTCQDSRFYPMRELKGRPWAYWGDKSIFCDETSANYYSLSLTMIF